MAPAATSSTAHGAPAETDTRQIACIIDLTGESFVRRTFTDGADLLRDAVIERFELEALGWTSAPDGRETN
jgi:hypothetical protein